jgi:hypothetical protein
MRVFSARVLWLPDLRLFEKTVHPDPDLDHGVSTPAGRFRKFDFGAAHDFAGGPY